jgi:hypothetical protein
MSEVSRRSFLKGGSAAIVAAGAISALPGIPALAGALESTAPADASAVEGAYAEADSSASLTEPLVAHVRDLSTGEIGIFSGTREVTVLDPRLAATLARAVH